MAKKKKEAGVAQTNKWRDLIDESQLIIDEVHKIKLIPFKELLRVANIRGVKRVDGDIINASKDYAAVKVTVEFKDTEQCMGMACAGPHNVSGKDFSVHPVAIAQTRAFSRALRFGLGLTDVCAVEEVNFTFIQEVDPNSKAQGHQLVCIKRLLTMNEISVDTILQLSKRKITSIDDLRFNEAKKLIESLSSKRFINKVKKNEKST